MRVGSTDTPEPRTQPRRPTTPAPGSDSVGAEPAAADLAPAPPADGDPPPCCPPPHPRSERREYDNHSAVCRGSDARRRVALCIGNSNYQHLAHVTHGVADAFEVSKRLWSLGFRHFVGRTVDHSDASVVGAGTGREAEEAGSVDDSRETAASDASEARFQLFSTPAVLDDATGLDMLLATGYLSEVLRHDDVVVVLFSGHGLQGRHRWLAGVDGKGVHADVDANRSVSVYDLEKTLLEGNTDANVLLLLNCCSIDITWMEDLSPRTEYARHVARVCSSVPGARALQVTPVSGSVRLSPFATYLCQQLLPDHEHKTVSMLIVDLVRALTDAYPGFAPQTESARWLATTHLSARRGRPKPPQRQCKVAPWVFPVLLAACCVFLVLVPLAGLLGPGGVFNPKSDPVLAHAFAALKSRSHDPDRAGRFLSGLRVVDANGIIGKQYVVPQANGKKHGNIGEPTSPRHVLRNHTAHWFHGLTHLRVKTDADGKRLLHTWQEVGARLLSSELLVVRTKASVRDPMGERLCVEVGDPMGEALLKFGEKTYLCGIRTDARAPPRRDTDAAMAAGDSGAVGGTAALDPRPTPFATLKRPSHPPPKAGTPASPGGFHRVHRQWREARRVRRWSHQPLPSTAVARLPKVAPVSDGERSASPVGRWQHVRSHARPMQMHASRRVGSAPTVVHDDAVAVDATGVPTVAPPTEEGGVVDPTQVPSAPPSPESESQSESESRSIPYPWDADEDGHWPVVEDDDDFIDDTESDGPVREPQVASISV